MRYPTGQDHILRYSVVLFGVKHVVAHGFSSGHERAAYREHIVRIYNATII